MNQTSDPKNAQWGVTVVHTDTEMEGHSRCDTENAETMSAALLTGFNNFSKYRAIPSQCHFFSSPRFFLFKFFFHLVFWIYFIYDKKMELLLKYVITLKYTSRISDPVWYWHDPDTDPTSQDKPDPTS